VREKRRRRDDGDVSGKEGREKRRERDTDDVREDERERDHRST